MIDGLEGTVGIYLATLVVAALSGLIPIINAEIYLIGVALYTRSIPLAIVLGIIVAVGQMIAKIAIYQAALKATNLRPGGKFATKIEKARALVDRWRDKPLTLIFVSASVGLPPFFLVSILAGMLKVKFRPFVLLGLLGRSLRFVTIALLALLA